MTSAGVAAFVSSGMAIVAQVFERRARRRELLLSKAMELARSKTKIALRISEKSNKPLGLYDEVVLTEGYYQWLVHLLAKGRLPDDPLIKRPGDPL